MTSTSHARVKSILIGLSAVAGTIWITPSPVIAADTSFDVLKATLAEPNQKAPEISTEELRKTLSDKSAKVFDARPHLEYSISHIPGAVNVSPKAGVPMSVYVSDVAEIGRLLGEQKDTAIVLTCNGPFCQKRRRLGAELIGAGYTNIQRYQLGIPVWRALGGVTQIEPDGIRYVREGDKTAVWLDARSAEEFKTGSVPGARHLPKNEIVAAKDDGRLPMEDHNTRIIVFGEDAGQAREAAEEIAKNAFHNVSFYAGSITELKLAHK
jgi:rhodanese-related sulfurtransferase